MFRLLTLSTLACALFCASCTNNAEPVPVATPTVDTTATPVPTAATQGVNAITLPEDGYTTYDPVSFVSYLKENTVSGTVMIHQAPKGWIKEQHIPELVAMLDNTNPCAGISLINSGPNPPDNVQSSIAAEALLLIESYRQKVAYPAAPGSLQFIKVLNRNPNEPGKLILIPQPHQIEEAKNWAAKQK